jgi:hypothetical protein
MKIFQHMRGHRRCVPQEVIDKHELTDDCFDSKGHVCLEIRKGMHGLKEAAVLACDQLKAHLVLHGHAPVCCTPGSWKHNTCCTTFTFAVDDFGVKCFSKEDADHLFSALEAKCDLTKDWTGAKNLGFTSDWHYDEGHVDTSMPHYIPKAFNKFQHAKPKSAQHAPHQWSQWSSMLPPTHLPTSTKAALNESKLSRVLFSTLDAHSTPLFSQLSTKSRTIKPS